MPEKTYHVSQIARYQLNTAVELFLAEIDYSSVITLAGASSGILSGILIKKGQQPFSEFARDVHNSINGQMPPRQSYRHHIHKKLGISHLKHMGSNDHETIELDLKKCAIDSLIASLADYTKLYGSKEQFVVRFYNWVWKNQDGQKIMSEYLAIKNELKL